jgi:arsenate reductase-like glutaredoxin family protein
MKNIHVLTTEKPSYLYQIGNDLTLSVVNSIHQHNIGRHIYITSDVADINENDYIITKDGRLVQVSYLLSKDVHSASKVVLTTDQDLIKDGVQAIDDEFLEWFVNNPSCERVALKQNWILEERYYSYEIIIPKEEPKQETLEEAATNYTIDFATMSAFKLGAKWQQEQDKNKFSEEDISIAIAMYLENKSFSEIIKQLKNK